MVFNKVCTTVHYLLMIESGVYRESEKTFVGRIPASKVKKPDGAVVASVHYAKKRVTIADDIVNAHAAFDDISTSEDTETEPDHN